MTTGSTGLARASAARTDAVRKRIRDAMRTIELDIEKTEGVYPFNGGRLSLKEVCRRANVHDITLMGKLHRDSTKVEIQSWLSRINESRIAGKRCIRKSVTARADSWEKLYREVAANFKRMHSVEIVKRDAEIASLRSRILDLEETISALTVGTAQGTVVPIRGSGERGNPSASGS